MAGTLAWLARNGPKANLKGCVLAPFNKGSSTVTMHPLNTEEDEHFRVVNEVVIPACMEITPDIPEYQQRIKKLLSEYHPALDKCWNFGAELIYRMVAPPSEHTPENLTKMRILRCCSDLGFDLATYIDDVTDEAVTRAGRPCWHLVCPGGRRAAVYDGATAGFLPLHLLKTFFRDHPGYVPMMESVAYVATTLMIGQNFDTLEQGKTPCLDMYNKYVTYKTGWTFVPQSTLGTAFAGILDEQELKKVNKVFFVAGRVFQKWDDFQDYYCALDTSGKQSNDFKNGCNTWASGTAYKLFDETQKKAFLEVYGSSDPEKMEAAKKMYDSLDMPQRYLGALLGEWSLMKQQILSLANKRHQEACFSYADWLFGEICQEEFARELGLEAEPASLPI